MKKKPIKKPVKAAESAPKSKPRVLNSGYFHLIIPALIILLTIIVYSRSLKNGFTNWDDDKMIIENKDIRSLNAQSISTMFSSFYVNMYHPLTTLSFAAEYHFFGTKPFPYHLTNLILHLLNILLVYWFIILISGRKETAGIVALFFAIHPMHVESVAWVTERKDVLYTFFFMGSLIAYHFFKKRKRPSYILLTFLLFLLSLLSKSAAVVLPLILILMDWYYDKKLTFKTLLPKAPFLLVSIVFGIISLISQSVFKDDNIVDFSFNIIDRIFLITYSLSFYLIKFIAPFGMSAAHTFPMKINGFLPVFYYLSFVFILLIAFMIYKLILSKFAEKFKKELIFGLLFYIIILSPVIHLTVGFCSVAERYTYVPYIGLIFIVPSMMFSKYKTSSKNVKSLFYIALAIFLIAFSISSFIRTEVWKSSITLWTDVIEKYPDNSVLAYNNRADVKAKAGDYEGAIKDLDKAIAQTQDYFSLYCNRGKDRIETNDIKGALEDFTKSIALCPKFVESYSGRGLAKSKMNDYEGALIDFSKAIELSPLDPKNYNNRGNVLSEMKRYTDAIKDFNKAMEMDSSFRSPLYNRAIAKKDMADFTGAIDDFSSLIKTDPKNEYAWYNRGMTKLLMKNTQGAIDDLSGCVGVAPENTDALTQRGALYADANKLQEAYNDFSNVVRLTPGSASAYSNKAFIENKLQQYNQAIEDCNRAISINPSLGDAYHNRGISFQKLMRIKEACSDWQKAVQLGNKGVAEQVNKYCR